MPIPLIAEDKIDTRAIDAEIAETVYKRGIDFDTVFKIVKKKYGILIDNDEPTSSQAPKKDK